ncbi:MAG: hypothetical protein GY702_21850 [Desulfobulbaceae bacterium]|nr:hypothetical protein [Desulfobulbaceae bacterium]
MNNESGQNDTDEQLAKAKSEILTVFLEEIENLKTGYLGMKEDEIKEPTKKEAVSASLQSLRISSAKKSVKFLNPEGPYFDVLFQYVSGLGAAIDSIETAYSNKDEADIDQPTIKEAVLHPLNILHHDINEAIKDLGI